MVTETRSAPQLDGVRTEIREPLRLLAERLGAALGDNLKSLSVVGSSLTQDFEPKISDVNTVVLLDAYDIPALNAVARLAVARGLHLPQGIMPIEPREDVAGEKRFHHPDRPHARGPGEADARVEGRSGIQGTDGDRHRQSRLYLL